MSRLSVRSGSAIRPELPRFLWNNRIPLHHFTIVAGAPDLGKSTLGYLIAAECDVPTIFVTREETSETAWRPRCEAAGVDLDKVFHHEEIRFGANRVDDLAALVREYQAKLVIVDPVSWHLDCSPSSVQGVRAALEPYPEVMKELDFAIVFQVHVLRDIPKNAHPLQAVPAGLVQIPKAVYLFGPDPVIGADPHFRVLANADKFNFLKEKPATLRFEFESKSVRVFNTEASQWESFEVGRLTNRGEATTTARALLVTLRPEDKERKSDRVAFWLVQLLLKRGETLVSEIRQEANTLDPPVSWKTVERVADELGVVATPVPGDSRRRYWNLSPEQRAELEELTPGDDVTISEFELPEVPDVIPEEWTLSDDDASS
jgi:hypothetical protein